MLTNRINTPPKWNAISCYLLKRDGLTVSQVSVGEVLFGHAAPAEPTLKNRIIGFIELQRPAIIVLPFFPLVFSTAALAAHVSMTQGGQSGL